MTIILFKKANVSKYIELERSDGENFRYCVIFQILKISPTFLKFFQYLPTFVQFWDAGSSPLPTPAVKSIFGLHFIIN